MSNEDNALRAFLYRDASTEILSHIAPMLGLNNISIEDDWKASGILAKEIVRRFPTAKELAASDVFAYIVDTWNSWSTPNFNFALDYITDDLELDYRTTNWDELENLICNNIENQMERYAQCAMIPYGKVKKLIPLVRKSVKVDIRGIDIPTKPMLKTTDIELLGNDEICDLVDIGALRKKLNEMSDSELYEMLFVS